MDPLSQGLLGAVAAHAAFGRRMPRMAWLVGLAAGMAPDLDVVINPASDPLGGLLWHRHFTHAVAFNPIGAAICALPFVAWSAWRAKRSAAPLQLYESDTSVGGAIAPPKRSPFADALPIYLAALIGHATHAPLDAATSYGTYLWWPFSNARVAWDCLPIIDPIFTGVLLIGLIAALLVRRTRVASIALAVCIAYAGLGLLQRERAASLQRDLTAARGHAITNARVMPAPLTLLLWNSIYESGGVLHADAVRVPWPGFGGPTVFLGASTPRVTVETIAAERVLRDIDRRTIERWDHFASGFVARDPRDPAVLGDLRFLLKPDRLEALWGLRLPVPGADEWPRMVRFEPGGGGTGAATPDEPSAVQWAWSAIIGRNTDFVPVVEALKRASTK
jgi:inner membrane protein